MIVANANGESFTLAWAGANAIVLASSGRLIEPVLIAMGSFSFNRADLVQV